MTNPRYYLRVFLCALLASFVPVPSESAFFSCEDVVMKMDQCKQLQETNGTYVHMGLTIQYWIYEDSVNQDDSMDPLILIHGGPAVPSEYMKSLKQLACRGRKVIRYDQGGCGASYVPDVAHTAPFLFDLSYYPGELYALIEHLELKSYFILGHSWGTVVAQEFAITYPPKMSGMLLVGALSSGQVYIESQKKYRHSTLPPYLQMLIKQFEIDGDYSSDLYQAVDDYLTGLWTINTNPMPDCVEKALADTNEEIYEVINGPSEFTLSPVLYNWNVTGLIDGYRYPTAVIGGTNDTMTLECLQTVANGIPNSELKIIPRAAHLSFVDNPDFFMDYAQQFMLKHDRNLSL